jgi:bifunctional non-homologous end joining protein LigD
MGRIAAPAKFIPPMKALNSGQVPTGTWDCEIKFDGYRAIAILNQGKAELWSRNHKPMSGDYPEIVAALRGLKCRNAVLDGEIVALDGAGRSKFQLLQNQGLAKAKPAIAYVIFDLLHRDGRSLLALPLTGRRQQLEALTRRPPPPLRISPVFQAEPAALLAAARQQGLEGVIAKRPDSPYEPDRRSGAWVKCKLLAEQEFVIGGFTAPQHSRQHFGAILVGYYQRKKLLYAGKVGTGFDQASLSSLHAKFMRLRRPSCPFENLPMEGKPRFGEGMGRSAMAKVTWLRPNLVAQIRFAEWTRDGLLRQPVFLGLRRDQPAADVSREKDPV